MAGATASGPSLVPPTSPLLFSPESGGRPPDFRHKTRQSSRLKLAECILAAQPSVGESQVAVRVLPGVNTPTYRLIFTPPKTVLGRPGRTPAGRRATM